MLASRRRLLYLLLVLALGSGALAVTKMAAWWVVVPPTIMLLGYMGMLREAARADAERREPARTAPATATKRAAPPVPAAPVPRPDAEVIDISASLSVAGHKFYDQYADAKQRAVGDLASGVRADQEDLGAAERDVGVEGELLARGEPEGGEAAGEFGHRDLGFELAEVGAQAVVQALAEG